jgi:C1A family cysteine protease
MKAVLTIALIAIALAAVQAGSAEPLSDESSEFLFDAWSTQHSKKYADQTEAAYRYGVWRQNLEFIRDHNSQGKSWTLGMNQFGDQTPEEFSALFKASRAAAAREGPHAHNKHARTLKAKTLPTSWDWRAHGAVNAVQNQGQCGSCWAFTAGDAVSGFWALKTGIAVFPVSVEQIVDCSSAQGNQGCNGGLITAAFDYVIANNGLCDWQEYQYTAGQGTPSNCAASNCTNVATIKSYANVPVGDETTLMTALSYGPVSTAVEASAQSFQFYTSGVIDDPQCGTDIDHGLTAIGWGTDATLGKPYWLSRNMWGTSWGENGYVRLVRGKNMCGIAQAASYVTA